MKAKILVDIDELLYDEMRVVEERVEFFCNL